MDRELAVALPGLPVYGFSDLPGARSTAEREYAARPPVLADGVALTVHRAVRADGTGLEIRVFTPTEGPGAPRPGEAGRAALPGVLYLHGGGFCTGAARYDDGVASEMAAAVGAVVASVDYRLAPEHPYPAGLDDVVLALRWLHEGVGRLGADPGRLAVVGDSAGGGLAAALALHGRDHGGPPLAFQALLEPDVDDRLQTRSMLEGTDTPVWFYDNARRSWQHYLAGRPADQYAAPARARDFAGLPPAYLTVNELDPLRDEGLAYALGLLAAGVSVELHCWPGAFHGFTAVRGAAITRRAADGLHGALRRALGE